ADVRPELDRMAVYVACMSSGTGLKHKVLEAMAAGRPVVATPLGWAGIGPGPGLLDAAGPAEVAQAVIGLLRDRSRLASEGAAARERMVRDFTWERSAARVEEVWAGAIGG